jgi:Cu+-exporting ATPase
MMNSAGYETSNWVARSVAVALVACLGVICSGCAPSAAGSASPSPTVASGTQTLEFSVEGMVCTRCEGHIAEAVKSLPGVKSVEVSFAAKKATVVADAAQVQADKIEKAVKDAGFKAKAIAAAAE